MPEVSVIVPTYEEAANVETFLRVVSRSLDEAGLRDWEILVMDDDSPDGTAERVVAFGDARVRVVNRRGRPRGLSAAVIDGFAEARGDIFSVLDADLSHPPDLLPSLVAEVRSGAAIAVASRFVRGGGVRDWPLSRRIVSRVACLLARPVTNVKDATSGFFALRRGVVANAPLDARGFKIGLEVFVRGDHGGSIREIPYVFTDRTRGTSKFRPAIGLAYLGQIAALFRERIFTRVRKPR